MRFTILLVSTVSVISSVIAREKGGSLRNANSDRSLWKEEYENELTNAMLSTRKKGNSTRHALSTVNNEAVVDKLLDSISSSEKYLKKVDSIDFRLNRLDVEVHEKSNAIMNRLSDVMKALRNHGYAEKLEAVLDTLKTDITQIKLNLDRNPKVGDLASDYHSDSVVGSRLTVIESHVKSMMTALDSIVSTMSEVKTRQYSRAHVKTADTVASSEPMSMINEFRKMLHEQRLRKCECKNGGGGGVRVDRSERYPTDCHEIQIQGFNVSGIYKIRPDDMEPFYILCDFTTSGGGWTVFQNRYDGSQDFYRGWSDYKYGFGNLAGEFWLGLEKLYYLTNQKLYELRVEVEALNEKEAYAGYSVFTLGPEHEGYRISTLGSYYGNAGDSLSYHAGQKFSTLDEDNDEWRDGSCASEHGGAWWYKECDKSNLNGKYSTIADENKGQSMYWISFKGPTTPLSKTKMMIRPLPATRPVDYSDNRKTVEGSKLRPILDQPKSIRTKEIKGHQKQPYRFEDARHDFFPSYA